MYLYIAFLLGMAGFLTTLLIWSIRRYKILKLKERVERQLIRKEVKKFDFLEELGLEKLLLKTRDLLGRAGIQYDSGNTLLILLIINSLLLSAGLCLELGGASFAVPVLFTVTLYFVVLKMGDRRLEKIEQELRYMLYDMVSALRVNDNLINAISAAAANAREPLKSELQGLISDIARGEKEEKALQKFSDRTGSPMIAAWVDTIIFAKEMGREMVATCERAALKIRDKSLLKNKIRSQTAGAKGTMAGIAIILVLSVLSMFSIGTFNRAFSDSAGKLVILYVIFSYLLSTVWVFRTIEKEVNS